MARLPIPMLTNAIGTKSSPPKKDAIRTPTCKGI